MPLIVSPIPYGAVRTAIVQAIAVGTGLDPSAIVRAEPNEPNAPRPARPFATFKIRTASMRQGPDAFSPSPDDGPTLWRYSGQRGMALELNFFGTTQEDAYGMAAAMQFSFEMGAVQAVLAAPNVAVWRVGDVTDVSALLGTGYEGRAMLEANLGIGIDVLVDFGSIAVANVEGTVLDETGIIEKLYVNATLEEP